MSRTAKTTVELDSIRAMCLVCGKEFGSIVYANKLTTVLWFNMNPLCRSCFKSKIGDIVNPNA